MAEYWGYHYMINASGCDPNLIDDSENIANFTEHLVKDIDMVAYGEPQIVRFAEHDPSKAGYTLIQLIETSNIAAHFVPAFGELYLDAFSCKSFDRFVVRELVYKYFGAKDHNDHFILRKAPSNG